MRSTVAVLVILFAGGGGRNALAQPTREVTYNPRSVIRIDAHLRMTTLLVLPDTDEIRDFVCGDKDYWVIPGAENLAYIKPAKAGAATNLNLVTAAGQVYSFLLVEGPPDPDLKVYVVPDPNAAPATPAIRRAAAADLDAVRKEAAAAAERKPQAVLDRFKAGYPAQLRFPYAFKARAKPSHVTALCPDVGKPIVVIDRSDVKGLGPRLERIGESQLGRIAGLEAIDDRLRVAFGGSGGLFPNCVEIGRGRPADRRRGRRGVRIGHDVDLQIGIWRSLDQQE